MAEGRGVHEQIRAAVEQRLYAECRDPKYRYAHFPLLTHAESVCLADAALDVVAAVLVGRVTEEQQ